jgi:hypothetical protein
VSTSSKTIFYSRQQFAEEGNLISTLIKSTELDILDYFEELENNEFALKYQESEDDPQS